MEKKKSKSITVLGIIIALYSLIYLDKFIGSSGCCYDYLLWAVVWFVAGCAVLSRRNWVRISMICLAVCEFFVTAIEIFPGFYFMFTRMPQEYSLLQGIGQIVFVILAGFWTGFVDVGIILILTRLTVKKQFR